MFCYNCMNDKGMAEVCPHCGLDNSRAPAAHHLRPGAVLHGKYVVGYVIGEGGFGITYIGRDTTLDMRVAVKEYFPSGYCARDRATGEVVVSSEKNSGFFEKGRDRFLFEARSVAKFSSEPGIVDVRDYFEENSTAYIIMEYLDGMDLSRYIKTYGVFEAERAFTLMLPVMRSLERINAAGIIHRDISPDNIMYLRDGTLKLTDFGSARYFVNTETEMSVLLKQGYAPEEQYRKNGRQGPWTDVYGVCATLYRIITGNVPADALDRLHDDDLEPPSALGVGISPPLEKVLMYGLAVYSENRCQDMGELIALSERALERSPVRVGAGMPGGVGRRRAADSDYRSAVERELGSDYGDSWSSSKTDGAPPERPRSKKNNGLIAVIIIVAVALIIAGAALAMILSSNGGSADATEPVQPATDSVPDEPTAAEMISITDVVGMKLDAAMSALRLQGLDVQVEYIASDDPRDHVVRMSPEASSKVPAGTVVTLYIPDEKATEPPTEEPTAEPTQSSSYICMGVGGALLHKEPSRVSECYDTTVPAGGEVIYTGSSSGELMSVTFNGAEGWVLSRLFVPSDESSSASAVNDREYNEPLTCTNDTALYTDSKFRTGVPIKAGESAVQVGYCQGVPWDDTDDYYEIYYKDKVYYLPFERLHDYFEYSTTW